MRSSTYLLAEKAYAVVTNTDVHRVRQQRVHRLAKQVLLNAESERTYKPIRN